MASAAVPGSFCDEVRSLKALIKTVVIPDPPPADAPPDSSDWAAFVSLHDPALDSFVAAAPPELASAALAVATAVRAMPADPAALGSVASTQALTAISQWMDLYCSVEL